MQEQATKLPSGLTLVRVCPDGKPLDARCGTVAYWAELIRQIGVAPVARYFNSPDGSGFNKFLSKVTVWVYDPEMTLSREKEIGAEAYCEDMGNGYSVVTLKYFKAAGHTLYRGEGALSHELGHAWHNFARCFSATVFGNDFRMLWGKEASLNNTVPGSQFPWNQGQSIHEEFANAFRYFGGSDNTRGVSGPGTTDPVVNGFKDPASRKDWLALLEMLPETQGFVEAYGYVPGTLSWSRGENGGGGLIFQVHGYVWVCQTAPYRWFRWVYESGGWKWQPWSPAYKVA